MMSQTWISHSIPCESGENSSLFFAIEMAVIKRRIGIWHRVIIGCQPTIDKTGIQIDTNCPILVSRHHRLS